MIKDGTFYSVPAVDLAIAQLEGFDPSSVAAYPVFKDPSKGIEPGRSLCRLGYPFLEIVPQFDETANRFELGMPMTRFPIEGMFTRIADVAVPPGADTPNFPLRFLETSSPGFKGQSGGPIFDVDGTVWAIQVQTAHHPLGFSKKGEPEQYLNVGLGVSTDTLFGVLREVGVDFEVSDY